MDYNKYLELSKMAIKEKKAEKVFKNGKVLNVFTEEIIEGDIAVSNGIIVGVGSYSGCEEIDISGKYVVPGFVDSHLHLESTMVEPKEFLKEAVKSGTTTFVVDPHEAANVSGNDGIDYILNQTEKTLGNVFVMIPSCVPATSFEDNGVILYAKDMEKYLKNPRVLGLAEVMDTRSVITGEESMMKNLDLFKDKNIDGHAPLLNDYDLSAYALSGVRSDHEAYTYQYAKKEVERGMYVFIREGSAAKNLEAIVKGIVNENASTERYCFCTDDKHIEDIILEGHISYNIRKTIEMGINPIKAYKMATIQSTQCIGKGKSIGAIAPGYKADFVVLNDFEKVDINSVYFNGENVEKLLELEREIAACPEHLKQTVKVKDFNRDKLILKVKKEKFPIVNTIPGEVVTEKIVEEIPIEYNNEEKIFKANEIYNKIAVIERHNNTGKVGVGVLKGFGIKNGAIASTVAHDSHNIVVVGDNDRDMELAVQELIKVQGGYTIIEKGSVVDTLPLVIMGLISDKPYEEVNKKLKKMINYSRKMGINEKIDPFINLSFMALPVIPELRVTSRGIYDVVEDKFLLED